MKNGLLCCPMHPKAPLIAGIAVILFTVLAMTGIPIFLWLDIVVGAALVYAGATGNCLMSGMMSKCCSAKKAGADTVDLP